MFVEKILNEKDLNLINSYPNNLPDIDYKGFADALNTLRKEINKNLSEDDLKHLQKIEGWGKLCTLLGYSTSWLIPNPVSAFLMSQGNLTRWAMITHHVSHKGYDKVPNIPEKYKSKNYAVGYRRYIDWLDWMHPEAWDYEHNFLHHYHTGEIYDPDLVEKSMHYVRELNLSIPVKYALIGFFMTTWKLSYYAPNTLAILKDSKNQKQGKKRELLENVKDGMYPGMRMFIPFTKDWFDFITKCVLPYSIVKFVLIPLLFLPLGFQASLFVLINSILAEIITNIHSFLIIVPNHAGDDLYRFDRPVSDQAEFYVRQVTGSVNFKCGNDVLDFFQGWLNYQIEHHLFPDIPMLKYQQIQPKVKEICEKFGVPYVQENVFTRFGKLVDIITGQGTMKKTSTLHKMFRK
ncbi:MAG: fatty acid desaturase [Candidatus Sericytochromatia bacterium]